MKALVAFALALLGLANFGDARGHGAEAIEGKWKKIKTTGLKEFLKDDGDFLRLLALV